MCLCHLVIRGAAAAEGTVIRETVSNSQALGSDTSYVCLGLNVMKQ